MKRILFLIAVAMMLAVMVVAFASPAFGQEAAHGCAGINEALSHATPKGKVPHFVPPAKDVVPGLFIPPFRVPCPTP